MKILSAATAGGLTAITLALFFIAFDVNAADNVRYRCTTVSDEHVLTLQLPNVPVTNDQFAPVKIIFHGDEISAVYIR